MAYQIYDLMVQRDVMTREGFQPLVDFLNDLDYLTEGNPLYFKIHGSLGSCVVIHISRDSYG